MSHLEAQNLHCIRQQKLLFKPLDFSLDESGVLLIVGPNGSGKSTLLRLLSGLATPAEGEIRWQGQPVQQLKAEYWQQLHYCGHANGIKLGLTVAENLRLTQHLCLAPEVEAAATLSELNLREQLHTKARYLSAGQRRRIALAKLFLYSKKLWLLDEPLTALDSVAQEFFFSKLQTHLQTGGMAVISSHHPLSVPENNVQRLSLAPC